MSGYKQEHISFILHRQMEGIIQARRHCFSIGYLSIRTLPVIGRFEVIRLVYADQYKQYEQWLEQKQQDSTRVNEEYAVRPQQRPTILAVSTRVSAFLAYVERFQGRNRFND